MPSGFWSEMNRTTGNLVNTGLQGLQLIGQQRHQGMLEADSAARLKLAQDQAQIQNATANLALEEGRKKQAAYDRPMNLTLHPAYLSLPDEQKPQILKFFADNKYAGETGIGKTGDIMQGTGYRKLKTSFPNFMKPVIDAKQGGVLTAWNEFKEAQATGDSKKVQVAKAKFDQLNGDYHQSLGKFDEHIKTLTDAEEKIALEKAKNVTPDTVSYMTPDGKTVLINERDPNSQKMITEQGLVPATSFKGGATQTEEQLISKSLTEKLGRPSTATEILAEQQKRKIEIARSTTGARIDITNAAAAKEGFQSWTPEAKEQTYMYNAMTGKPPVNAAGLGGKDRQAYGKGYAQWQVNKGLKPGDISLMQADYRAGDMSLKNMAKQEAPMNAFVLNINKQIDKVRQLYDNNDRTGLRLLDLPIRQLKLKALGSGEEAVKASYLLEISNEIGKLSSGASGSVQQLSDSAKEDWKKVHDVNLSFKEVMKVVNATRDQANMRISTWREAKQQVRSELQFLGVPERRVEYGGGTSGGFDLNAINAELQRRGGR